MRTSYRNIVVAGLVAFTLAGTAAITTGEAEAHNNFVRGLGAGLAGAAIGGAIIAGLHGSPQYTPYESYAPQYAPQPVAAPTPYNGPQCHIVWQKNRWGDLYRTQVCD
ncbi:hypothetical protein HFN68_32290 [Rhizobium laguerreae]|uniref:hypothetical protein n=1 Tax=Rhizobium laguerreae TaxID=1076926 RepID=UPI001C9271AD|nr:hypothetical protein [Rhizobium laguerreae]MBY3537526.1 hypothetical protein [Rhizobium laguerreae]